MTIPIQPTDNYRRALETIRNLIGADIEQAPEIAEGLGKARSILNDYGFFGRSVEGRGDPEVNAIDDALELLCSTPAANELVEALRSQFDWVEAALNCKTWDWDGDQREVAEQEHAAAKAVLERARSVAPAKGQEPISGELVERLRGTLRGLRQMIADAAFIKDGFVRVKYPDRLDDDLSDAISALSSARQQALEEADSGAAILAIAKALWARESEEPVSVYPEWIIGDARAAYAAIRALAQEKV